MTIKYKISRTKFGESYGIGASGRWPKDKLGALKESVRKWEFVVSCLTKNKTGVVPDADAPSCALCRQYLMCKPPWDDTRCSGCPVFEYTGKRYCKDTPFYAYERVSEWGEGKNISGALKAAQREVAFLKKLVPIVEAETKEKTPAKRNRK